LLTAAALLLPVNAHAFPPPWQPTETRAPCSDFNTLRSPHFGDLHIHTSFSHDAYIRATRVDPAGAYSFAQGGSVMLPDETGALTRSAQLDRPLDFAAVTDHAEFLGETRLCSTPGSLVYDEEMCVQLREISDDATEQFEFFVWGFPLGDPTPVSSHPFCFLPGVDCDAEMVSVWQDIQAAAEAAYDRTATCSFTTFIGYEQTASPGGSHLHRNIIFRNENVPGTTTSHLEVGNGGAPQGLWDAIENDCLDAGTGCEAVIIPHNSNLSGGLRWPDPLDAADARRRQRLERLVEIHQHKASSECRFDRMAGMGTDTTDELCTFEQDTRDRQGPWPALPVDQYPRRNMVRNVLKDGLAFEQSLDVNPFKMGFIGSTDTHNGTAGDTDEPTWNGADGFDDADAEGRMESLAFGSGKIRFNPGGLAVVWAEENSRDAIYEALDRREAYATSGTRPVVRFFAGTFGGLSCGAADFVEQGYRGGAPMGADIGAVRNGGSPEFAVLAFKDPGSVALPGTDLQRVQIVKGWVDAGGQVHEQVFDVAGDASNGATVNPATCEPVGAGASELCAIWKDPTFDETQRAFYYVRVLENPTCRWSTLLCKSQGVDPFDAANCATQAALAGEAFADCCLTEADDPFMEPVIQERAWSSPIWYRPEAISRLKARVKFGNDPGTDTLKLRLKIRKVPSTFDVTTEDLTISVTDDDEIYRVTIPAGSFTQNAPGKFVYSDPTESLNGLKLVKLDTSGKGGLKLRTGRLDLSNADGTDHMVQVTMGVGTYGTEHTRLWEAQGNRLSIR
jgi:hypothetical protein